MIISICIFAQYNRATFDKCDSLSGVTSGNVREEAARLSGRNLCAHLQPAYGPVMDQLMHVQLRSSEEHPFYALRPPAPGADPS